MAKITLADGMVIEGTIEELKQMAKAFGEPTVDNEYRKVIGRKPKVGDFVKFTESVYDVTAGKYYEVKTVDGDGDGEIIDDVGDEFNLYGEDFEVYEIAGKEPAEDPFKVGDYVRVVSPGQYGGINVGEVGKIVEGFGEEGEHRVDSLFEKDHDYFYSADIVRATDEEVAEAKRKFEEVKKWAKIGRKPNEFKKGDAVRYKKCFTTVVASNRTRVALNQSNNVETNIVVSPNDLTLVFPVEARFDV
jgi:hypothetical protein